MRSVVSDESHLFAIADAIALKPVASLSQAQKAFRVIWDLEAGGTNNGGFRQYFFNMSGREAPSVEMALRLIGATECADLVGSAFRLVNTDNLEWMNDTLRRSHLESVTEDVEDQLNELDQKFFAYPDPLSELPDGVYRSSPEHFLAQIAGAIKPASTSANPLLGPWAGRLFGCWILRFPPIFPDRRVRFAARRSAVGVGSGRLTTIHLDALVSCGFVLSAWPGSLTSSAFRKTAASRRGSDPPPQFGRRS